MKNFLIFTSKTEHLAEKIRKSLKDFKVVFVGKNKDGKNYFPDGEAYARLNSTEGMKDARVVVLHSGCPDPNGGLIELELILQILKDNKIAPEVFFTYFPYGQQDKVFQKGETNAAESLIKKLTDYYKVKKIYGIDLHFEGRNWLEKYPVKNISAVPALINTVQKDFGKNIIFLSPDKGGKRRSGISGLEKKRTDSFEVKVLTSGKNFKEKTVGVIDDIIETGGTLAKTFNVFKKNKAKRIIVLITHGVLESGVKRIRKMFSKLYLTNTIAGKESNVDISCIIAENLKRG